MKDDTNDLSHIQERHTAINLRLEEWAKWVRVRRIGWFTQPMFRLYQSKARQWEANPHIPVAINGLHALEIERAVSMLPDPYKTLLRWYYVFPWKARDPVAHKLGLRASNLPEILDKSRDMVKNRVLT